MICVLWVLREIRMCYHHFKNCECYQSCVFRERYDCYLCFWYCCGSRWVIIYYLKRAILKRFLWNGCYLYYGVEKMLCMLWALCVRFILWILAMLLYIFCLLLPLMLLNDCNLQNYASAMLWAITVVTLPNKIHLVSLLPPY